jgi:hypothetical protein
VKAGNAINMNNFALPHSNRFVYEMKKQWVHLDQGSNCENITGNGNIIYN